LHGVGVHLKQVAKIDAHARPDVDVDPPEPDGEDEAADASVDAKNAFVEEVERNWSHHHRVDNAIPEDPAKEDEQHAQAEAEPERPPVRLFVLLEEKSGASDGEIAVAVEVGECPLHHGEQTIALGGVLGEEERKGRKEGRKEGRKR
jgi:hypothetical protein